MAPGFEWTEVEQITHGLIRDTADRVEVLKVLLDVEVGKCGFLSMPGED